MASQPIKFLIFLPVVSLILAVIFIQKFWQTLKGVFLFSLPRHGAGNFASRLDIVVPPDIDIQDIEITNTGGS